MLLAEGVQFWRPTMIDETVVELLHGLKSATGANRIRWENLPDEEMFRTTLPDGLIRIGETSTDDEKAYTLWIMDDMSFIVDVVTIHSDDPQFPLMELVYRLARLAARNGKSVMQRMVKTLAG